MKSRSPAIPLLLLLLASAMFATRAEAHEPGMVELTFDTIEQTLRAELDLVDLDYALGLDEGDGNVTTADVGRQRERIAAFVVAGVHVSGCRLDASRAATGVRADASPSVVVDVPVACDAAHKLRAVGSSLFAELPDYRSVLQVKAAGGTQTFALGAAPVAVPLGDSGHVAAFVSFLREGIVHILIGVDHLAFLLVLVLPITARGSRRAQVRSVAGIVTAFTVAHSLTLSLSALGHLGLPAKPVELLIAATVVFAAVRNLGRSRSAPGWLLAYAAGAHSWLRLCRRAGWPRDRRGHHPARRARLQPGCGTRATAGHRCRIARHRSPGAPRCAGSAPGARDVAPRRGHRRFLDRRAALGIRRK